MMSWLNEGKPTFFKQVTWLGIIWAISVLALGCVSLLLRLILKH
jgi:Protein of unknown function (DUF2474)